MRPEHERAPAITPGPSTKSATKTDDDDFTALVGQKQATLEAMTAQETRDLAAKCAEQGLPAFPIGLSWNHDKESIGKAPRTKNGFKNASSDPEIVETLFLRSNLGPRQQPGVGVCPGPGGYIVLDIDVKGGATGLEDLAQLEKELGELPPAMTVKTPSGGLHLWFRRPHDGPIGNRSLAPGVEVRCDAGFVVAPGVTSPWGSWERDPESPHLSETPELPKAWADKLDQRRVDGSREPIADKLTVGSRHDALRRVAGAMRRQGSNYDEVLAALTVMNQTRCDPPKPQSEIAALAADIVKRYPPAPDQLPIQRPEKDDQVALLEKTRRVFRKWLHLPDDDHVLCALGAVAANLLDGDPLWLLFVGPPGSGKTEVVQPLAGLDYVHPAATLSEAALLSGVAKKATEKDATGGLLRQIGDFGIVLTKDFSGVLSLHRDARAAVLAALREVFDGSWSRPVGTGGGKILTWQGKVGLIGAVTPTIDRHSAVMGALGERFVLYRLADPDEDNTKSRRSLENFGHQDQMRAELAEAARSVLSSIGRYPPEPLSNDDKDRLTRIAGFVVKARTAVERDGYRRTVEALPEWEHATRLVQQLAQLRAGLLEIGAGSDTAWRIVIKAGLDSIPRLRWQILNALHDADHPLTNAELLITTGIPRKTLAEHSEDLALLGLVNSQKAGEHDNSKWTHQMSVRTVEEWPEKAGKKCREGCVDTEPPINLPFSTGWDFSCQQEKPLVDKGGSGKSQVTGDDLPNPAP